MTEALKGEAENLNRALAAVTMHCPRGSSSKNLFTGLDDVELAARDAITHRANSLLWHVWMLNAQLQGAHKLVNRDVGTMLSIRSRDPGFATRLGRRLSYLLEDILFSGISLVDYSCRLLAHLFALKMNDKMVRRFE